MSGLRKLARGAGWIAAAVLALAGVTAILSGGRIGSWPLFDRVNAAARFEEHVTAPLPTDIIQVRGGCGGFQDPTCAFRFRFAEGPRSWAFLKDWTEMEVTPHSKLFVIGGHGLEVSRAYERQLDTPGGGKRELYLFIDDGARRGNAYVRFAGG